MDRKSADRHRQQSYLILISNKTQEETIKNNNNIIISRDMQVHELNINRAIAKIPMMRGLHSILSFVDIFFLYNIQLGTLSDDA